MRLDRLSAQLISCCFRPGAWSAGGLEVALEFRLSTARLFGRRAATEFDRAETQVLMAAALKLAKLRLDASAEGSVIIEAEEQKQRAGRAQKTARPASAPLTAKAWRWRVEVSPGTSPVFVLNAA